MMDDHRSPLGDEEVARTRQQHEQECRCRRRSLHCFSSLPRLLLAPFLGPSLRGKCENLVFHTDQSNFLNLPQQQVTFSTYRSNVVSHCLARSAQQSFLGNFEAVFIHKTH